MMPVDNRSVSVTDLQQYTKQTWVHVHIQAQDADFQNIVCVLWFTSSDESNLDAADERRSSNPKRDGESAMFCLARDF